jgi:dihydrofolate reductase
VSSVIFDMSMSLDGYVRAANPRPDEPLGEGGEAPTDAPAGGVYVFVTTGIEDALAQAQEAADGKDVTVMGGPAVGNQFLRAGLVDELSVHLVPVLFGAGTPLTETLPAHIELEPADHVSTSSAMHLRYRIRRASSSGTPPT